MASLEWLRCSRERQAVPDWRPCETECLLELCEVTLGLLKIQHILLRVNGAEKFILAGLEFGFAHIVFRGQQAHLILCGLHGSVGFHFDNLLLGLHHVVALCSRLYCCSLGSNCATTSSLWTIAPAEAGERSAACRRRERDERALRAGLSSPVV